MSLQVSGANQLLIPSTVAERKAALFSQHNAIPLQVIRLSDPQKGKQIGCVSLTPKPNTETVELGYYLHPSHQKKGIVSAAARKVLGYAAENFGVRRVYSSADILNAASKKIIEGLARDSEDKGGQVFRGSMLLKWPEEKKIEGREPENENSTWEWSIVLEGEEE